MDRIELEGIQFHGFHGVPDPERAIGHRYRVDLSLELDLRAAGQSDDLGLTVDYGEVARRVIAIGTGPSVHLVEALAERLAAAVLSEFAPVQAVDVRVAKLQPPFSVVLEACAVRIRRTR